MKRIISMLVLIFLTLGQAAVFADEADRSAKEGFKEIDRGAKKVAKGVHKKAKKGAKTIHKHAKEIVKEADKDIRGK